MFLNHKHGNMLITTVTLISIFFVFVFFIFDDNLDPKIQSIIDKYNTQYSTKDNGSVYQLGMWSKLDKTPYQIGLWRVNQYKEALAQKSGSIEDLKYEGYTEEDWILQLYSEDSKPDLLCNFREHNCLESIYERSEEALDLAAENAIYIERYNGLMEFNKFELYEKPTFMSPFLYMGPNMDVLQLKLMALFQKVKSKKYKEVSDEISKLVLFNKKVLEQTPYLMMKIVSVVELEQTLNAAAFLISRTDQRNIDEWQSFIETLTQLTQNQLKMNKLLHVEFVSQVNSLDILDVGEFEKTLPNFVKLLPHRILFKRNKSINMSYSAMTANMDKIELVGDKIVSYEKVDISDFLTLDYSNVIGSLLMMTVIPRVLDIETTLYDIEVKQRMIKHQFRGNAQANFVSPYNGQEAYISNNMFCSSSHDDRENDICVSAF